MNFQELLLRGKEENVQTEIQPKVKIESKFPKTRCAYGQHFIFLFSILTLSDHSHTE